MRSLADLANDPACVPFASWRGFVLRVRSMANNNDDLESVVLFRTQDGVREVLSTTMREGMRWDSWLIRALPFRAHLEFWDRGERTHQQDIRPTLRVAGPLPNEVQLVPVVGYRAEAWSLVSSEHTDEEIIASMTASNSARFEFEHVPFEPFALEHGSHERPISPLYAEHGQSFVDWISDDPFLGPTQSWDGSVTLGGWVPAIAIARVDDPQYATAFADYLENI